MVDLELLKKPSVQDVAMKAANFSQLGLLKAVGMMSGISKL